MRAPIWVDTMVDLYLEELELRSAGFQIIAGVDEVGRGCLAGPVFAAAVILPPELKIPKLNDSKKLTASNRETIAEQVLQHAQAHAVASVSVEEIDRINILRASLKAMVLALQALAVGPDLVLVDGHMKIQWPGEQKTLIGGDGRAACIAAASVIAKVARDRYMAEQEKLFPQFRFSQHKGYGTALHQQEIAAHGLTPLHRRSFGPIRDLSLF